MKNISKSSVLVLVLAVLFVAFGVGNVQGASKYPEKPITLIVPCGPGCGADVVSRAIEASFKKNKFLPQPFVIENKPGAAHAIAYSYVASKTKDPYYLVATATPFITTPLLGGTPFNYKSFTLICNLASEYYMLMVPANSKYKSMKELVADAKANPRKLTFGGSAFGGADFVSGHVLEKAAGIQFNNISYDGGNLVMAALLGNHLDTTAGQLGESLELYKASKIRILGTLSEKRLDATPEIPTMREQGIDAVSTTSRGIAAPLDIPADARKVLEEAFYKYTHSDDFKNFAKETQLTLTWMDGPAFGKWIEKMSLMYAQAHKEMGIIPKK